MYLEGLSEDPTTASGDATEGLGMPDGYAGAGAGPRDLTEVSDAEASAMGFTVRTVRG